MQLGSSVSWQAALMALTGSPKMDAGPMLEYFEPLYDWLEQDNTQWDTELGWAAGGNGAEKSLSIHVIRSRANIVIGSSWNDIRSTGILPQYSSADLEFNIPLRLWSVKAFQALQ